MPYKLVYKTNGITATHYNRDSRVLRELIKRAEDSNIDCEWELYNAGGIKLDSSAERKPKKGKK